MWKGGDDGKRGGVENGQVNASQPIVPIKLSYTGSFRSPQLWIFRIVINSTTSKFAVAIALYGATKLMPTPSIYLPSNCVYVNTRKLPQVTQLTLCRNIFVFRKWQTSADNLLKNLTSSRFQHRFKMWPPYQLWFKRFSFDWFCTSFVGKIFCSSKQKFKYSTNWLIHRSKIEWQTLD